MICSRKPQLTRRNRWVAYRTAVGMVVFDNGGRCDGRTVVPPPQLSCVPLLLCHHT
ncbi:expressed unknown protein [Ectocarpus siliculosus]|uniref:Uncharacterized protein n=1 Tax=Ectocarpus siliculosus TaxID=2880 RepID=D8LDA1_ECTSI|nr:expressed unknown protein [Ectocarpus siliculosus]|eukprot:CBN80159.1 expressed unknown protein [Ectocarpus siliculosus]